MVSYADLLTLMLAFFIVLYSQSINDVSRLKEIEAGMISAFHGTPHVIKQQTPGNSGILKHHRSPIPVPDPAPPSSLLREQHVRLRMKKISQAEKQLRNVLAPMIANHEVNLSRQPLSLRIRLDAKILYPSGQAKLTSRAKTLLTTISGVLQNLPPDFPIVIQGYTNKKPIHTAAFPSNWELSTMRAVSVVHLFRKNGMPGQQLSAQGFSKFHPVDTSDTPKALRVNRRVAILIQAPQVGEAEPHLSVKQAMQVVPGGRQKAEPQANGGREAPTSNSGPADTTAASDKAAHNGAPKNG
ncbi:OmpA family protein [Salinisphaera sp. SWV1]